MMNAFIRSGGEPGEPVAWGCLSRRGRVAYQLARVRARAQARAVRVTAIGLERGGGHGRGAAVSGARSGMWIKQ